MSTIVVFGGTGYTGGHIVREAASRGHQVISVSRTRPSDPVTGVRYEIGSAEQLAPELISGADAVVATLSPRGDMAGRLVQIYGDLAAQAATAGARYLQVGGFSSLRSAADAPRFAEGDIPAEFRGEVLEGEGTRAMLVDTAPDDLDWVFVSPPQVYGSFAPGERTGRYRISGEVALLDEANSSSISGADFALAIVDEVENPRHHRAHIGVAG
jgi:putative NADH-flavin reductase